MACRQRLLVLAVCYAMRTTFATPVLGEFTRECAGPFTVPGDAEPLYLVFSPANSGEARIVPS